MKRFSALILALALTAGLTACGIGLPAAGSAPAAAEAEISSAPETPAPEETPAPAASLYTDGQEIAFDLSWQYAEFSAIHTGSAVMYLASGDRKNIIVGVNAGHGTAGGTSVKTQCHPDGSPKTTGGSTAAGATESYAVSVGMTFADGTPEAVVTLNMARLLRDRLLAEGYDVLMLRDGDDVQLDNVARTVMCNNIADCHIAIHWDGDDESCDKGVFYCSVPDALGTMEPVASTWQESEALGRALVTALSEAGVTLYNGGSMPVDLTQTSYSSVPSVDIELGNENSDHSDDALALLADALVRGVNAFFGQ